MGKYILFVYVWWELCLSKNKTVIAKKDWSCNSIPTFFVSASEHQYQPISIFCSIPLSPGPRTLYPVTPSPLKIPCLLLSWFHAKLIRLQCLTLGTLIRKETVSWLVSSWIIPFCKSLNSFPFFFFCLAFKGLYIIYKYYFSILKYKL